MNVKQKKDHILKILFSSSTSGVGQNKIEIVKGQFTLFGGGNGV
jgi:hypothetical protein